MMTFSFVFRWIACAVYGLMVGYLASLSADAPNGMVQDTRAYQNFGLIVGAGTGLALCLLAHLVYVLWKRFSRPVRFDPSAILSIVTGIIIGFTATFIVHRSANSFGLLNASIGIAVTGSIFAAVIGGLLPAVTLWIMGNRN